MPRKNVFVVGLDELNEKRLLSMPTAHKYRFHSLYRYNDVKGRDRYPLAELLSGARAKLDRFKGSIDGIVGFWDFPVSSMVPVLCRDFGVPGPSVESVLKCEHKYWSRLEQTKVIDDVPRFQLVDPFAEPRVEDLELDYPFWLKPVKSFASVLAFKIEGPEDYTAALPIIRERIHRLAKPFNYLLTEACIPPEIAAIGGQYMLAEECMEGHQCTVEGFAQGGRVETYGIIDSFRYSGRSVFSRYQYPSQLPPDVQGRIQYDANRVIRHLGFDQSPFNIEFFYDPKTDRLRVLEINQRISQSHADLFGKVDGMSNLEVMVSVATGERPRLRAREGPFEAAAKCFLRVFQGGIVTEAPTAAQLEGVAQRHPGVFVTSLVQPGMDLCQLFERDSYSYLLAEVYLGGASEEEILATYDEVVRELSFRIQPPEAFSPVGPPARGAFAQREQEGDRSPPPGG